jgi:hypothetical protein
MKDTNKMIKPMEAAGYYKCMIHDVYYDESLECPACVLKMVFDSLQEVHTLMQTRHEIVDKFNPRDRS